MSVLNTPVITAGYSDSFWDDQYKGCDILSTRLRKSKETSEEIKRLYQSRAEIEQEYGDKLLKLSQNTNISQNEEESSFAETLSHISSTLETTARAHIDLAQKFKDHLEVPLDNFIKEQRDIRKSVNVANDI
ncbi:hypothetical protein K501DRAFT_176098 [Backusella circina FSU 941]|nr:hypothetical protein K501DRAFT_176098 [Backusella circina FSU 941]